MQNTDMPERAYHPNATENAGAACFKDQARICGADCMAYLPQVPEGKDYVGEQWASCKVLVDSHRSAKHLTVIADILNKIKEQSSRKEHPVTTQAPPGVR